MIKPDLLPHASCLFVCDGTVQADVMSVCCWVRAGIPIVFDFHHWKFCTGDQSQEEAFRTALTTWPAGGGRQMLCVSTDGLHAYTCMLISSHPTRIVKQ